MSQLFRALITAINKGDEFAASIIVTQLIRSGETIESITSTITKD